MAKAASAGQKGLQFTRSQVAECFGVSLTTVDAWVRRGCPREAGGQKGVGAVFNSAAVARWLRDVAAEEARRESTDDEQLSAMDEAKLKKLQAEAVVAEVAAAKALEQVVELDIVEKALANAFAEVQVRLRNLPGRVVSLLIGETDEVRFKSVLGGEIDAALENLANLDLTGLPDDDGEDEEEGVE